MGLSVPEPPWKDGSTKIPDGVRFTGYRVEEHRQMADVIQAYLNGAMIECRPRKEGMGGWVPVVDPIWNFPHVEYRVVKTRAVTDPSTTQSFEET
jgi:hypothetical protein